MNDNYQRLFQKRKVGADGEFFSLDFPVAIPNIQKNPVHLVKMNLETPMISSLKEIIRSHGDEQQHASNVKADMTDWFMHEKYQEFKQLSICVEAELKRVTGGAKNRETQKEIPYVTTECWGAVYRKGEKTIPHTHWGSLWSWCYYLKVPDDAPPPTKSKLDSASKSLIVSNKPTPVKVKEFETLSKAVFTFVP